MFDVIIKNGKIMDPSGKMKEDETIYIKDGIFVKPLPGEECKAVRTIDASGCIVTPGLIDSHIHVYRGGGSYRLNVSADVACLPNGVTTCIDGGSAGPFTFESFYRDDIAGSLTTVKAMLHMSFNGIMPSGWDEIEDPRSFDSVMIKRLFSKYPDEILGLKIRQHAGSTKGLGTEPLKATVNLADELEREGRKCCVTVHVSHLCDDVEIEDILNLLREGDVFTHTYQNTGKNILDSNNRLLDCVKDARERGVIFDAGTAVSLTSVDTMQRAFDQGFFPDIIGTDIVGFNFYKKPLMAMPYSMSNLMNMGMPLEKVIAATTLIPAKVFQLENIAGTLDSGKRADVSVFKLIQHESEYNDPFGNSFTGKQLLVPMATVKEGIVQYRQLYM